MYLFHFFIESEIHGFLEKQLQTNTNSPTLSSRPVLKCFNPYKPFIQSHCLATISVGQEVHEGDKFLSTIHLINQSFNRCTICIDDSLQRHSIALEKNGTAEEFYNYSIELGKKWLKRNQAAINQLQIPFEIIYWDKWLNHKYFETELQNIKDFFRSNTNCREAFETSINKFLSRYLKRQSDHKVDIGKAYNLCRDYLFEECTALCLWVKSGFDYELYPSKRNEAMDYIHKNYADNTNSGRLTYIYIKFKNRKQLQPQSLEISC